MSEEKEKDLLDSLNDTIEQIENKEVINKEKVDMLPEKIRLRDKKRRWRTHFTQSKSKKKRRELINKNKFNEIQMIEVGKSKKILSKKSLKLMK